jgi:hypothetical protein
VEGAGDEPPGMGRRLGATATITPPALPTVWLARDVPPTEVGHRLRDGRWTRVGRGVYVASPASSGTAGTRAAAGPATQQALTLARIVGTHRRLVAPHWFSHESAAAAWGLPLWRAPRSTHITVLTTRGGRRDPLVSHHLGELGPDDVATVSGLPVTSLARTVADCLTTLGPLGALVVADAALHRGVPVAAIEAALDRAGRRNGSVRARSLLALADDGAESPGETATRFVLLRDGFPVPTTQIQVATRLGTFWADLGFEAWRLLIEYDGRGKYEAAADEAFFREKERHHAVVERGHRLLRVTRTDLRGHELARRLTPLLPQALTPTFTPRRELMR